MTRLVALDRDGTVIEEHPYLADPQQVALLPNAAEGIRALRQQGLKVVLVTNQSGLGRGYFNLYTIQRIHERLLSLLAEENAPLDGIYFCPHAPSEGCSCRKPKAGLLERAAADFRTSSRRSFVVGDKDSDIEMGRRAGATTILVRTGYGSETERLSEVRPHHIVDDLLEAALLIINKVSPPSQPRRPS